MRKISIGGRSIAITHAGTETTKHGDIQSYCIEVPGSDAATAVDTVTRILSGAVPWDASFMLASTLPISRPYPRPSPKRGMGTSATRNFRRDIAVVRETFHAAWIDPSAIPGSRAPTPFFDGARPIEVLRTKDPKPVMEAVSHEVSDRYR